MLLLIFIHFTSAIVLQDSGLRGDICQFPDGVTGRCEEIGQCIDNAGSVERNGTIKLCEKENKFVIACCRKPYEIAAELCTAWNSYWTDNDGQCVFHQPLIIGGETAEIGEFPHIAMIGYARATSIKKITWDCSGILVAPHFVLTAAHCVLKTLRYIVKLGEHNRMKENLNNIPRVIGSVPNGLYREVDLQFERRNTAPIEQTVRVEKIIIHPDYDLRYNDIALLRLERSVVLTKRVLPACLPTSPKNTYVGRIATVSGWGTVEPGQFTLQDELMTVDVPILERLHCWESLARRNPTSIPKGLTSEQICAGADGKDSCQGDSGGPMIIQEREACEHTLIGIVSFGFGCGKFGLYTRVSSYVPWITSYIAPGIQLN